MPQDITILIVTYNSEKVIETCLKSLPEGRRILVLDNGSVDGTVALASRHPGAEIIRNTNIGYGKAANAGLAKVTTPYALLLNPDVILAPDAAEALVATAKKHPDIGILGAQMFDTENGRKTYQKDYVFDENGLCGVRWIVGALMLFNMEALKRVGTFDENIFLFFEETDLCNRFLAAGYRLAVCQKAEARHAPGTSSPPSLQTVKTRAWHSAWSRAYYYQKHYGAARCVRKSLTKIVKNIFNILKDMVFVKKARAVTHAYEIIGALSFFLGIKAYNKHGKARMIL